VPRPARIGLASTIELLLGSHVEAILDADGVLIQAPRSSASPGRLGSMATPVRDAPEITVPPSSPLDDVLRRVNRIRTDRGADPLYSLPSACTAWDGGGCVLERAFEDLGVLVVDYRQAHGRGFSFDHGLGDFVREFDTGRYPNLVAEK
jgi:hypothetical protein